MSERRWTSPSQLGTYGRCQLDWYYQKIEKRPFKKTWRAPVGTAMGEFANQSISNLMAFGAHLPDDLVEEITGQAFDDSWAKEPPELKPNDPPKEACKQVAITSARCWLEELSGKVESPVAVEPRVEMYLDFVDVDLLMYPDLIDARGNGQLAVVDWKTGGAKKKESEAEYSHQLSAYAWACEQPQLVTNGTIPQTAEGCSEVALGAVISLKTKTYSQWLEAKRHAGHIQQFKGAIWAMEEQIRTGRFMPADPNYGFACGPDCAHWMYCPHGSRDVTLHKIQEGGGV